jgi:hypothetical protein
MLLLAGLMPVFAYAAALDLAVTTDKASYNPRQLVVTNSTATLDGTPVTAISSSKITIKNPSGATVVNGASMTGAGNGAYTYDYPLADDAPAGTWTSTVTMVDKTRKNSGTGSATFTVASAGADATPPVTTASPPGGTYLSAQTVTLTANEPATIYCTLDGTSPTTASPVCGAPLSIAATTTLKYFARDAAGNSETVQTQTYTVNAPADHAGLTWTGYAMCMSCHRSQAEAMYQSVHYQWKGSAAEMTTGPATQGKMDAVDGSSALNAYCINIQGNWGACATCHVGNGAKPVATATPTDAQLASIDCLICHNDPVNAPYSRVRNASTGLFEPAPAGLNMDLVVQKANVKPVRKNCLNCHANAGGGDAVKRGDLALASGTTADVLYDTHMATSGANIPCQGCHTFTAHRVAGRGSDLRPLDSTVEVSCSNSNCHATKSNTTSGHVTTDVNHHVGRVACQTCHIPRYAKNASDTAASEATETHRTWEHTEWNIAFNRYEPMPTKANDLIPKYAFWNGTTWGNNAFNAAVLDSGTGAYKISRPVGAINDPVGTKLYPFKYKTAAQALANGKLVTLSTARLFATGIYDDAVQAGLTYMGMAGAPYATVTTDEYQALNHQVPPSAGNVLACAECHENTTRMDLPAMGYALKAATSVVCAQCHREKTPGNYTRIHSHSLSKGFDCSWCHTFSRPERGLTMP